MCGEKPSGQDRRTVRLGSPPRVRGKVMPAAHSIGCRRITPACAGKRGEGQGGPAGLWDHPRVCGEKAGRGKEITLGQGSPPRVRGKVRPTPGKSRKGWDHPRVCGEKRYHRKCHALCRGSPPRVRGKGFYFGSRFRNARITPACAGKRATLWFARSRTWDHPRVCGEKAASTVPSLRMLGSPPRVRGKVTCTGGHADALGITPACAGKRQRVLKAAQEMGDHPRVCGEKKLPGRPRQSLLGSPPRVRGKAE